MPASNKPAHEYRRITGLYVLHFEVESTAPARIGKLGEFTFGAGHYLYVGSGMNSLWTRLRRHLDRRGPRHRHIDHLRDVARPESAWVAVTGEKRECELAGAIARMPGVDAWPARFGASDCGCPGHLLRLPGLPDQIELVKAVLSVGLNLGSVLAV